jgi:hypothetical protein
MAERPDQSRELIFVGTVESIGPPPDHWRGPLASYQEVRYRVEETIKGIAGPRLLVIHTVVKGSPTAEPGDVPGLSSSLFFGGARLLVMGVEHAGGWCYAPSEYFGAMPYSRLLVEKIRAASAAGGSAAP